MSYSRALAMTLALEAFQEEHARRGQSRRPTRAERRALRAERRTVRRSEVNASPATEHGHPSTAPSPATGTA